MKIEQNLRPAGVFTLKHFRDGKLIGEEIFSPNIVVTQGKDYIADVAYNNNAAQQTTWYLALYGNNLSPASNDTADGTGQGQATPIATRLGELNSELDNGTNPVRETWTPNSSVPNTGAASSNSENPASFTMAADDTIYGAYLISDSVKAGITGILLAASDFGTSRVVLTSDILQLTYSIALT